MLAAQGGHVECMRLLVEGGATIDHAAKVDIEYNTARWYFHLSFSPRKTCRGAGHL